MLPLSPEQMRSSTGNSIESVEQPWVSVPVEAGLLAFCLVTALADLVI